MTIRVLLADDQELIRAGFAALISSTDDLEVVAEVANGDDAVAAARELVPDVVLMDIRMPGTDGLSATEQITSDPTLAGVHVIVLTTFEADEYVLHALRAGASGFLGKGVRPQVLLEGIRGVVAGDSLLSPQATRMLIAQYLEQPETTRPDPDATAWLTAREQEIVSLVALGLDNAAIADKLVVSPHTVKTHVNRAMSKVGARDRAQLVVFAFRNGLASP